MSEHRVSFTEVPATRRDDESCGGVLIHIRPPVQLNPDAVRQYLMFGTLEALGPAFWEGNDNLDIKNAVLLGSTAEQTTIYASIDKESSESLAQQVANDTVELLRFMGARAIIDNPPASDA
jgi:hypothetical protein